MIKKQEVKHFRETFHCDRCGEEMKTSEFVLLTSPPQYRMTCKCGETRTAFERYPRIVYEIVEENKEEN